MWFLRVQNSDDGNAIAVSPVYASDQRDARVRRIENRIRGNGGEIDIAAAE
ncbi:MAG: hypothetical protein AB8G99_21290 [Planctomycetaceae bacterium]